MRPAALLARLLAVRGAGGGGASQAGRQYSRTFTKPLHQGFPAVVRREWSPPAAPQRPRCREFPSFVPHAASLHTTPLRLFAAGDGDAVEVLVPQMGESVTDGTMAGFLKQAGDAVETDEVIAQIETDKARITGSAQELLACVWIALSGRQASDLSQLQTYQSSSNVCGGSPSFDALAKARWPTLLQVTIDVRSPEAGVLEKYDVKDGDTVTPGTKVATVIKGGAPSKPAASSEKPAADDEKTATKEEAAEPKIEEKPPKKEPDAPPAATKAAPPPPPPPSTPLPPKPPSPPKQAEQRSTGSATEPMLPPKERERRVPMTRLRKRVAVRLKDSQNTFALLTTFNEIDMTNLMALRNDYKDTFVEKHGVKLGFMSAFVKAAVAALKQEPSVNAVIDGEDIIYRDYVDISIAVGTPKGLVVPVIRGAESMNFAEIEKTINHLGKKARDGTISIDDMAGGTFTISNGGVYGSLLSTPIINPPQSAILGMHSIQPRPMVVGNDIMARPMMYVALTYDHRLIDGREAVLFLRRVKDVVEDPRRLLLDV
eukprot:SM000196S05352  [mRNA]  locus=s196:38489:42270:+ [translate_table: standard]